jgi:hypothetical protein
LQLVGVVAREVPEMVEAEVTLVQNMAPLQHGVHVVEIDEAGAEVHQGLFLNLDMVSFVALVLDLVHGVEVR